MMIPQDAGSLLLLFLLLQGLGGKRDRAPSRAPAAPDAPYEEPSLFTPPAEPSADDLLWARYVGDTSHAHPLPVNDSKPVVRKMTRFERWALGPYFPVAEDFEVTIRNGVPPEGAVERLEQLKKTHPELVKQGMATLERIRALTYQTPAGSIEIWFPRLSPLYSRWWLGILGHELAHVAQIRMGLTPAQTLEALVKHGYEKSPVEDQAREWQRRVLRGLAMRAREHFRGKR